MNYLGKKKRDGMPFMQAICFRESNRCFFLGTTSNDIFSNSDLLGSLALVASLSLEGKGSKGARERHPPPLPSPPVLVPWQGTKIHYIQLSGCFVPVGPARSEAPFCLFFSSLSKDPKGVSGPCGWAPRSPHRGCVVP